MFQALENHKDVQSTLSEILPSADFESDSDLEKELSELINGDDVHESTTSINNKEELNDIEQQLRNLDVTGMKANIIFSRYKLYTDFIYIYYLLYRFTFTSEIFKNIYSYTKEKSIDTS